MRTERFWTWFDEFAKPRLGARAETFRQIFEHLDTFDRPVTIVETGCARRNPADDESWKGDGCSTVLFNSYIEAREDGSVGGSFDVNPEAVILASLHAPSMCVMTCDGVAGLASMANNASRMKALGADLIYLDSFDYRPDDPLPSAIHHHAELMAALPMIRPDTLVVVDDAWATIDDQQRAEVGGKGFLVARHMLLCGADLRFCSYQSGWTNVGPVKQRADEDLAALVDRARAHVEADRVVAAEQLYRLILGATTPPRTGRERVAHGEACAFYAKMALGRQRHGAAADWFREAIQADPYATDYRVDLVLQCFLPMGNLTAALTEAQRAAIVSPDNPGVWRALGGIHHEMGNPAKCIEAYDNQIALDPNDPNAALDRCTIAIDVSDFETVKTLCERVMGTNREPDALACLGMVAYREHRHEDAIELYTQAIAAGCRDAPVMRWNKSLALHSIGRYAEAWIEHEAREFQRTNPALFLPMRRFTLPRWNGEPPDVYPPRAVNPRNPNDTVPDGPALVHVHYEAGAGDNLCLARYLPLMRERGYRVRFECAEPMMDLMRSSFPDVQVVPKAADYPGALGISPFDYHCPIGSLPAIFKTEVDSIPWSGPYLKPDPILVDRYRAALRSGERRQRKLVGLCWSSGIRHQGVWMPEYGLRKSMHFHAIMPLLRALQASGVEFVSLQVGPEREQASASTIVDVLPSSPTWGETAALVANLDLVITVDTSVAHLAGGMGKPVWVMTQRDAASWHFMCWRPGAPWNDRSPWYPTARVFRQHTFDQPRVWEDVAEDVAGALREWLNVDRNHVKEAASA